MVERSVRIAEIRVRFPVSPQYFFIELYILFLFLLWTVKLDYPANAIINKAKNIGLLIYYHSWVINGFLSQYYFKALDFTNEQTFKNKVAY